MQGSRQTSAPQSAGFPPARRDKSSKDRLPRARCGPLDLSDIEAIISAKEAKPEASNTAIAREVNRHPETVAKVIKTARAVLGNLAEEYALSHIETVRQALKNGDAKSLAVAARATQWALESISQDGQRVVDVAKTAAPAAPAEFKIGIAVGGVPLPSGTGGRTKTADEFVDALPPAEVAPEDDTP